MIWHGHSLRRGIAAIVCRIPICWPWSRWLCPGYAPDDHRSRSRVTCPNLRAGWWPTFCGHWMIWMRHDAWNSRFKCWWMLMNVDDLQWIAVVFWKFLESAPNFWVPHPGRLRGSGCWPRRMAWERVELSDRHGGFGVPQKWRFFLRENPI